MAGVVAAVEAMEKGEGGEMGGEMMMCWDGGEVGATTLPPPQTQHMMAAEKLAVSRVPQRSFILSYEPQVEPTVGTLSKHGWFPSGTCGRFGRGAGVVTCQSSWSHGSNWFPSREWNVGGPVVGATPVPVPAAARVAAERQASAVVCGRRTMAVAGRAGGREGGLTKPRNETAKGCHSTFCSIWTQDCNRPPRTRRRHCMTVAILFGMVGTTQERDEDNPLGGQELCALSCQDPS